MVPRVTIGPTDSHRDSQGPTCHTGSYGVLHGLTGQRGPKGSKESYGIPRVLKKVFQGIPGQSRDNGVPPYPMAIIPWGVPQSPTWSHGVPRGLTWSNGVPQGPTVSHRVSRVPRVPRVPRVSQVTGSYGVPKGLKGLTGPPGSPQALTLSHRVPWVPQVLRVPWVPKGSHRVSRGPTGSL